MIPLTQTHERLRLQLAQEHKDWSVNWQQVFFYESGFILWYHNGRICVRRYSDEHYISECIIKRYSGRTSKVMA